MSGRDFVFADREMHQFVHFPHHNHVSIHEDDALPKKRGFGHGGMTYYSNLFYLHRNLSTRRPWLVVQEFEDVAYPTVSPQLRPGVREPGIMS